MLLICSRAPYAGTRLRDAIDAALAFCTFEQPLSLLLLDEAVTVANSAQFPDSGKNLGKLLLALVEFGVDKIFLDAAALNRFGMCDPDPMFTPLDADEIPAIIAAAGKVLNC